MPRARKLNFRPLEFNVIENQYRIRETSWTKDGRRKIWTATIIHSSNKPQTSITTSVCGIDPGKMTIVSTTTLPCSITEMVRTKESTMDSVGQMKKSSGLIKWTELIQSKWRWSSCSRSSKPKKKSYCQNNWSIDLMFQKPKCFKTCQLYIPSPVSKFLPFQCLFSFKPISMPI